MANMAEIAGTGFFYSHKPDGGMDFARMVGDKMEMLDPDSFAAAFGREVGSQDARKQAQNLVGQLNSSRRQSLKLAPFDESTTDAVQQQSQELNAQAGTLLGGR